MKRTRKGFTLVELVIVLGVVSILGAMGMVSGSEVSNMANANKIIEDFKMISAAMNMYYADNKAKCDATAVANLPAQIKTGLANYMKSTDALLDKSASGTANNGKYLITVVNTSEWWLTFTLSAENTKLAKILENKAPQEGLMATAAETTTDSSSGTASPNLYKAEGKTVCWRVR
ncbi:MAG: prepilin-type N-terminal cleavage/methylation domain-containing protein [Synergistaceae bacterium]|nr:prepilin-type N-terminal cleavage/methylation domain-containing protein [Synergistaceae bacterium]